MSAPQRSHDSTSPIKASVLGFGLAGRVFHAPFIAAVDGLELASIVQRSGDSAAKAYPEAAILRSVEEALDSDASLIVVGTPNETHFELTRRALEAGKHVVVDKPLCATSDEALALAKLARERNLILAPYQNRRWDGDFRTVCDLLHRKAFGRLVTFNSHFDRFRPVPRANTWKEVGHPANGLLFDLGPHLVDQILSLFGAPSAITASVRIDRDPAPEVNTGSTQNAPQIEDAFDITLHYPRLLARASSSMIAADNAPRFLLHGTHGSFRKHGLDPQEPALVHGATVPALIESNGEPVADDWLAEDAAQWGHLTSAPDPADPAKLLHSRVATAHGDYRLFYRNVRDAIRGTAPLAVTPYDAYRTIRILELARESSRLGRTLPVDFAAEHGAAHP